MRISMKFILLEMVLWVIFFNLAQHFISKWFVDKDDAMIWFGLFMCVYTEIEHHLFNRD